MATKAYLTESEFEEGKARFLLAEFASPAERRRACSLWLEDRLYRRLAGIKGWEQAGPIRLGSWARQELCPKSDVDLLMVGNSSSIENLVGEAQRAGIKIRSRQPEDLNDWSVGVDAFDILMLESAKAFTIEAKNQLEVQKSKLLSRVSQKRRILSSIRKERRERARRYDSVSNYLEPNLKMGAGGLRDLEQALAVCALGQAKNLDTGPLDRIFEAKEFLLCLRQMVHWSGGSDILAAGFQTELARILGFSKLSELMKEVQIRLERGSFYADWVVEQGFLRPPAEPPGRWTPTRAVTMITRDPGLRNQYWIRRHSKDIWRQISVRERGRFLQKLLAGPRADKFWVALSRSLLLEGCLPDLKRVKGLTQHDHYHRFTVETHLYQTLRETDRLRTNPANLFALSKAARELTNKDWTILRWTALFHDLGKGREKDHSTVGASLVRSRMNAMGVPATTIEAVEWLVQNHLILTSAAFRENVSHPSTWKRLFDRGVSGPQLTRLSVFSAIDIRATNPDSWNDWKARLITDLFDRLRSPTAVSHERFFELLAKKKVALPKNVVSEIDPYLIESLPRQGLVDDLKNLVSAQDDLPVSVRKGGRHQLWVRFHRKQDRPGLFLEFVQKLFWAGARIDAASAMTLEQWGAYDWFLVRSTREARDLAWRLSKGSDNWRSEIPKVTFQNVEIVSEDEDHWILSFRGRDQKGLLLAAAQALFDQGLAIQWARVHTWGNQIDDVFCVEAQENLSNHLRILREKFVT